MKSGALASGVLLLCMLPSAMAAPDEKRLGKDKGYPVGTAETWYSDESVRVGSFSHQAEIRGIFGGTNNVLRPSDHPLPLPSAPREPDYRWDAGQTRGLTVDDFLARQRIMGLIVVKDGIVQVERYQYDRKATDRFVSQSMAKSIIALAVGHALAEGKIKSLDDLAQRYAGKLRGTVYGETTIRNLLRMSSGAAYKQSYDGSGDTQRFGKAVARDGVEAAARSVTTRDKPQGSSFNYASPQSAMLAAVVRGATGMSLSDYLTPRLWQAMGAQDAAYWNADRTGLEIGLASFNATLRDYARLGVLLANDGVRPDDATRRQIVPREFLLEATDWNAVPEPFRPGRATPGYGYGYQFWLYPGVPRRFMMLGVYGQSIFVDPAQKLVIVQTAANATPQAGDTTLARERDAFWRGVMRTHDRPPPVSRAAAGRIEFSDAGDFSEAALRSGVKGTKAACDRVDNAVWASTRDHGEECLRYWAGGFNGKPVARALVFFHGDLLTQTGVPPAYLTTSTAKLQRMADDTARQLDAPYVFVGRPGTHGSSGEHRQRRRPAESALISAALDQLTGKLQVGEWVVAGQSGGGHVTSSLLTRRADIVCAVPTSAPSSPRIRWLLRGMTKDDTGYADSYEPSEHLQKARMHPKLRVFVLGDPNDSNVLWPSQTIMADKLRESGIPVEILRGEGAGPRAHGLPNSARVVASWCYHSLPTREILRKAAAGLKG